MESETPARAVVATPGRRAMPPIRWVDAALIGLLVASLALPAWQAGLWDPHELSVIELGRRIAVGLYGGAALVLDGATNALPTRGEVGRGELPFTAIAVGLRLFGLHAWAARVVLVLFALAGLAATYALVRRLVDRAAALLSVLVLGTMPLYFLHARTLLGDGITMAALAVATAGLALAVFDAGSSRTRAGFLALGLLGIVAGALSRGLLLGAAVPALGVGFAWLLSRVAGTKRPERVADVAGAVALVVGVLASALGALAFARASASPEHYQPLLGFAVVAGGTGATFDAVIGSLGHALFPWSAFVPLSLGRMLLPPPLPADPAWERESGLRLTVVLVAALGVLAWSAVAPVAAVLPFGAVAPLAVMVALAMRDVDRGAPTSPTLGLLGGSLLVLLALDYVNEPQNVLSAYGVQGVRFPEALQVTAARWFSVAGLLAALPLGLASLENDTPDAPAFARADYLRWFRTVRDLWGGNLLFGACVAEASLLGFVAFDLLGERLPALRRFAAGGEASRVVSHVAWLVIPVLLLLPLGVLVARDALRWLDRQRQAARFGWLLPPRGSLSAAGGLLAGLGASLVFYPALARQLSPQESFESFTELARPGEKLGMVGASATAAPYAAGRSVATFSTAERAFDWLMDPDPGRRWLVVRSDALAGMNSRYRGLSQPGRNLPVLDGRSSEILLVSSRLLPGERNENPLEPALLSSPPTPRHRLDANLGDQLDVLGWEVTDLDGKALDSVVPGHRVAFVIYFRVIARITTGWETFVHIDGFQRRFNADHPTLGGRYPFALWRVGDLVADRHEFALEPNFTPGEYRVYFGLYSGNRRLPLRRGAGTDDRIDAGPLVVR